MELTFDLAEKFLAAQPFSGYTISYLRPGEGVVLRAEAKVVQAGSRQATCTCELSTIDGDGDGTATLCAVAQGTVIALRR